QRYTQDGRRRGERHRPREHRVASEPGPFTDAGRTGSGPPATGYGGLAGVHRHRTLKWISVACITEVVAQSCTLLYRGFAIRRALDVSQCATTPRALPTTSRRYSRLQICATRVGLADSPIRRFDRELCVLRNGLAFEDLDLGDFLGVKKRGVAGQPALGIGAVSDTQQVIENPKKLFAGHSDGLAVGERHAQWRAFGRRLPGDPFDEFGFHRLLTSLQICAGVASCLSQRGQSPPP